MSDALELTLEQRLQAFVGRSILGGFDAPFILDGRKYFTNGSIWARIPAPGEENTNRPGLPEDPPRLFRGTRWKTCDFAPWPEADFAYRRIPCACDMPTSLCPHCGGDGEVVMAAWTIVNGRYIRPVYHQWISRLPNAEFMVEGGDCDWLAFRFAGGEGIVKPIYHDDFARLDLATILPPSMRKGR